MIEEKRTGRFMLGLIAFGRSAMKCKRRRAVRLMLLACVWTIGLPFQGRAAAPTKLLYPVDIAVATDGTLYVADTHLPGIWSVTNGKLAVFFHAKKEYRTPLHAVRCVAMDNEGHLLAGDSATREVYRFGADGKPKPLTGGKIGMPMGIAVRKDGTILVSDLELHCIWQVPSAGGVPTKFCDLQSPIGIFSDSQQRLWVVSRVPPLLRRVSRDGQKVDAVVSGRPFSFPHAVVVDKQGVAFVSDGYGKTIWRVSTGGQCKPLATGKPLVNPVGMTQKGDSLLVADSRAPAVFQILRDGKVVKVDAK